MMLYYLTQTDFCDLYPVLAVAEVPLIEEAIEQMQDIQSRLQKESIFNLNHISVWTYDVFWSFYPLKILPQIAGILQNNLLGRLYDQYNEAVILDYAWDLPDLLKALYKEKEYIELRSDHLELRVGPIELKEQLLFFHGYFRGGSAFEIEIDLEKYKEILTLLKDQTGPIIAEIKPD